MLDVLFHALTIPLAIIYAQLMEWIIHKYVLHNMGKNKKNWFAFHWHHHHKNCKKNNGADPHYEQWYAHSSVWKEIIGLTFLLFMHIFLASFAPFFFITLVCLSIRYFYLHRKSHIDVEWGKKNLPWHHDHHMGKTQDANWGVTTDWVDRVAKTRIKYTKEE